jgi:hypothetical protein
LTTVPTRTPIVLAAQSPALNHQPYLVEFLGCRGDERLTFVCAQLEQLGIATGDQPLTRVVGVSELEEVALVKETKL